MLEAEPASAANVENAKTASQSHARQISASCVRIEMGREGRRSGCPALVPVVETANFGQFHDCTHGGRLDRSWLGRVFAQRQMRSRFVVVGEEGSKNPMQMAFPEHDDVVEAFAANRADEAFSIRILPGRARRGEHLVDADGVDPTAKLLAIDAIAVADHVLGRSVLGKCLDDLLGGPLGTGVFSDVEMKKTAPVVGQNEKDIQDTEGCRGHGEEVDGRRVAHVIVEERTPGLRWRLARLGRHEAGNASLADVDAEFEQFTMTLGAPQSGLALAIWPMSALVAGETSSWAGVRGRDFHLQNRRNPVRCQRTTVSGLTMTSTSAQRDQRRDRTSQKARSAMRMRGRPDV